MPYSERRLYPSQWALEYSLSGEHVYSAHVVIALRAAVWKILFRWHLPTSSALMLFLGHHLLSDGSRAWIRALAIYVRPYSMCSSIMEVWCKYKVGINNNNKSKRMVQDLIYSRWYISVLDLGVESGSSYKRKTNFIFQRIEWHFIATAQGSRMISWNTHIRNTQLFFYLGY